MQNEDRAEEAEHRDVLSGGTEENVSSAEFLVRVKGLAIYREDREDVVEGLRDGEGCEDDEEAG